MSAAEFAEWKAFFRLEPWGEKRADARAALLAMVMANLWRGPDSEPANMETFMLPTAEQTEEELEEEAELYEQHLAMIEIVNAMYGGDDLRKKR